MGEMAPLRNCPKCGQKYGLIHCSNCHGTKKVSSKTK